eukprot:949868-Rhodomonas_salina.1
MLDHHASDTFTAILIHRVHVHGSTSLSPENLDCLNLALVLRIRQPVHNAERRHLLREQSKCGRKEAGVRGLFLIASTRSMLNVIKVKQNMQPDSGSCAISGCS